MDWDERTAVRDWGGDGDFLWVVDLAQCVSADGGFPNVGGESGLV